MKKLFWVIAALAMMAAHAHAQTYPSPTFNNVTAQGVLSLPNNPLALSSGGLGATTAAGGRSTLGLGTAATQNTGTSGHNLPFLDGVNIWSNSQTINSNGGAWAQLVLNPLSTSVAGQVTGTVNGSPRWVINIPSVATGDFSIDRYVGGVFTDTPFKIANATGVITLSQPLPVGSGGTGGTTQATARSGIGAAASGANSDITSLSGLTTALSVAQGGTGGNTQATARTGLGLGSIATQAASAVAITGGAVDGTTVGATTASTGRFTTLAATSTITPSSTSGIVGTTTNDNANAGSIGEFASNQTTGTSLTSNTGANATSVSLSAGDWDVECIVRFTAAGSTTVSSVQAAVTTTSATYPGYPQATVLNNNFPTGSLQIINSPVTRISVSATTPTYCFALAIFGTSTMTADGYIRARRVR